MVEHTLHNHQVQRMCSPGVSLCFSNVTKNMGKRIRYNPSELRNGSHSLHGEGFSSASLSISKYGSWEQIKNKVQILTFIPCTNLGFYF